MSRSTLHQPADNSTTLMAYNQVKASVRAAVERLTPVGSTIAVINKGDAELLHFPGRHGWHFPRRADGQFLGHHPKDGSAATDYLRSVRQQGANYLVIPTTYSWWLDHYPDFRHELESSSPLAHHDSACRIYSLSPAPVQSPRDSLRYRSLVQQVREVVHALLPADAKVAVASKGDDAFLNLDGRKAYHFPRTLSGSYLGHHPADDRSAIDHAIAIRSIGAEYLVFPKTSMWWFDHYAGFTKYLEQHAQCVAAQDHVCRIFEWNDASSQIRKVRHGK